MVQQSTYNGDVVKQDVEVFATLFKILTNFQGDLWKNVITIQAVTRTQSDKLPKIGARNTLSRRVKSWSALYLAWIENK